MLSLSDFKEKQILFVQTQRGAENKIKFWNNNIRYFRDGKIIDQASCHKILSIFIIGNISITNVLIEKCKKYGISIFLLKNNFEQYAQILSEAEGNYLLRSKQYNNSEDLEVSKMIVANKIYNQSILLNNKSLYSNILSKIAKAKSNKELLGIEGSFTKHFFKKYFNDMDWKRRSPRTKIDISNLLLDIGYTYLFNFIDSILRLYGFDTYKGYYHKLFFQRRSLACDVMESFRCVIEYQLLKSFNLKQICTNDFIFRNYAYKLKPGKYEKYTQIFWNSLFTRKKEIYSYIKQFYHYNIDNSADFPFYKFK